MKKFLGYLGGVIGSIALSNVSVGMIGYNIGWSFLSIVDIVFGIISLIGLVVFSIALLWEGVRTLFSEES